MSMFTCDTGPGPPSHHHLRLTKSTSSNAEGYYFSPHKQNNGDHQRGSSQDKIQGTRSGMLSAKDLTGAPLISYVPSNRKLRKSRQFQPLEKKVSEPGFRERHFSEHSSDVNPPSSLPPSNYYLGQNLYQKRNLRGGANVFLQDFYQNPSFGGQLKQTSETFRSSYCNQKQMGLRHQKSPSKSCENLSDTISVTSDESDNFKPRIIKPRRRRKKEKRRLCGGSLSVTGDQEDGSCLGSEKQWLPQGLLSAESESCGDSARSESASSDEREVSSLRPHRKLGVTLSVPTYASFSGHSSSGSSVGSDYYSQISPGSISSGSSSSDHLCDSDSGNNGNVNNNDILPIGSSAHSQHTALSVTKSYNTSCSYFRSPKLNSKAEAGKVNKMVEKTRLRKTNSWAYPGGNNKSVPEFSLFSPGTSTDLLSGIRKHLSKIDLNEEELK